MAEGHGGYRRPNNPNAVSGPGKYSRRTDGGPGETVMQAARYLQGDEYGESKELNELQGGAPRSAAPDGPPASTRAAMPEPDVIPMDAPSARPDEPITAGAPFGPGPGPRRNPKNMSADEADFVAATFRAAYEAFPSPGLRRMIERLEDEGR